LNNENSNFGWRNQENNYNLFASKEITEG